MAAIELPVEELPGASAGGGEAVGPEPASKPIKMARQGKQGRSGAKAKPTICLPKGLVDAGEKPLDAALREVREETGVTAVPITKLADIKYVYIRSWGDRERVFKIVSFYLLRYESGRIDQIAEEMRIEVGRAFWMRLEDAPGLLAYRGEKQMARKALEYVASHPVGDCDAR